jgi:hypothetical protein
LQGDDDRQPAQPIRWLDPAGTWVALIFAGTGGSLLKIVLIIAKPNLLTIVRRGKDGGKRVMRRLRLALVLASSFATLPAFAETRVEEAVRLSKLTLSAMECANLAVNDADSQRLQEVGMSAGKQFLEAMPKLTQEEQKSAGPKIALLWREVIPGPSIDFILGRVWERMTDIAYKSLGDDTKKWDSAKVVKYSQKNCMIIR